MQQWSNKHNSSSTKDKVIPFEYFGKSETGRKGVSPEIQGEREFHQKCREGWLGDVAKGLHVSLLLTGAVMPGSNQFVTVTNAEGTLEMSTQLFEV